MATAPQPLVDDILAGRCLPFIGAGFSLNARIRNGAPMPDWAGLTRSLASMGAIDPNLGGPAVASAYEHRFGRVQLIEAVRRALHSDHAEPATAHAAFVDLPFESVYTTNFDLLLEDAYSRARRPFRSLVGELQLPFHGGPLTTTIVKMHGDLRHEEHIVLTAEDYQAFLGRYPVIATHLSALLITRTALFIGYSLTDPDFQSIRAVVRSRLGKFERMAYVLTFDANPADFDARLSDKIHVISLPATPGMSRDEVLAEFFRDIQLRIDVEAGARFRAARPTAFEDISERVVEDSSRETDAATLLASSSNVCFVLMPFSPEFEFVYDRLIRPAAESLGLTVVRADEFAASGAIVEQIRVAIQQSRVCIADLTGHNANVLYEVGMAHSFGKPTVLLTQSVDGAPFDIRGMQFIVYGGDLESFSRARSDLERSLRGILGEGRIDEASRLIEMGSYRAAVAILGVLLEHELRRAISQLGIPGTGASGRYQSLGQMMNTLAKSAHLIEIDLTAINRVIAIRNRAVHGLEETDAMDARLVLDVVRRFASREKAM